ncbi:hypothetical protein CEXT_591631 [Caerostris extrusa]|uniref:Uncharacterized protein n=1 Tax=Caerostris extrusa TaxID=172846 RepID=A0AAV4WGZ7_CAEEX|nr:hypothetical protein CEXT_591631 [Caerostris extrusa]
MSNFEDTCDLPFFIVNGQHRFPGKSWREKSFMLQIRNQTKGYRWWEAFVTEGPRGTAAAAIDFIWPHALREDLEGGCCGAQGESLECLGGRNTVYRMSGRLLYHYYAFEKGALMQFLAC